MFSVMGYGVMRRPVHLAASVIRLLRILGFLTFVGGASAATPVLLNEFLASNRRSLQDEDGDRPVWIELFNPNAVSVDLSNYGLSDDPALPRKWQFPGVSIRAKGFLVVRRPGSTREGSRDPPRLECSPTRPVDPLHPTDNMGTSRRMSLPARKQLFPPSPLFGLCRSRRGP